MIVTKKQCEQFRDNPTINPLTGRTIEIGKVRHQQLTAACAKLPKTRSSSNFKRKASTSPPMGPYIHWRYNPTSGQLTDEIIRKNIIAFMNHIHERLGVLKEKVYVSEMEFNDHHDLLVNMERWLENTGGVKNKEKLLKGITYELSIIEEIRTQCVLLDDEP